MVFLCSLACIPHSPIFATWGVDTRVASLKFTDKAVVLDKKTNIHVIALDSLSNSAFTREFLGVDNPADKYLSTLNNSIYAGNMGFTEQVATTGFWKSLFELDKSKGKRATFSGHYPSLLTVTLRENGYAIQTGFKTAMWHSHTGPFIDAHIIGSSLIKKTIPTGNAWRSETGLACEVHGLHLLGLCSKKQTNFFKKVYPLLDQFSQKAKRVFSRKSAIKKQNRTGQDWLPRVLRMPGKQPPLAGSDWPSVVINAIRKAEYHAESSIFSAFYIFTPIGHTGLKYTNKEHEKIAYRNHFNKQAPKAQQFLEKIDHLRNVEFPDSIFIISGDHGPFLSNNRAYPGKRRFVILDRYNVALALLNESNLCAYSRNWLKRQEYLTAARMVAASLACNGEGRKLLEGFKDRKEFIQFGKTLSNQH